MVQRYLATSTNVQSRDKAASCLSQPTSRLPSQMSSMYGQSTTSTTPCMFSYAWHIIGYDWLSRFKKKRSLISEFKSTNDCRPEEGREGGQEGPLSLCLDEVKVRRGGGTHTHKWRRVTQCFANVHARHTHTRARAHAQMGSQHKRTHTHSGSQTPLPHAKSFWIVLSRGTVEPHDGSHTPRRAVWPCVIEETGQKKINTHPWLRSDNWK